MLPGRTCKYSGETEYWVEIRESGEKRQRKEVSEDRYGSYTVGLKCLSNKECICSCRPVCCTSGYLGHIEAVILISHQLQDKSTKPMGDVDVSELNKMDARSKAVAAAGTATAQAMLWTNIPVIYFQHTWNPHYFHN